ncbi:hypothetical protein BGX28_008899 [Mortierella sp. GBA30]|nr:hypothetical protein BGX28_008899 [Mortierella sp. GBA30]
MSPSKKTTVMIAIIALILCLSSTVATADLINPGKPFNCTDFAVHCKELTMTTYGNGKNASYSGPSTQCNTTLPAAQPLCGEKVLCLATFLVKSDGTPPPTVPLPIGNSNTTAVATPTSAAAAAAPTSGAGVYSIATVDMTSQILGMYDTSKCANAAVAKAATSIGALVIIASVVSFMSSML